MQMPLGASGSAFSTPMTDRARAAGTTKVTGPLDPRITDDREKPVTSTTPWSGARSVLGREGSQTVSASTRITAPPGTPPER